MVSHRFCLLSSPNSLPQTDSLVIWFKQACALWMPPSSLWTSFSQRCTETVRVLPKMSVSSERLFFLVCVCCAQRFSRVRLFATPCVVSHQAPLSTGLSSQVTCHFLLQGNFLTQESNPRLLRLLLYQADSLPTAPLGKSRDGIHCFTLQHRPINGLQFMNPFQKPYPADLWDRRYHCIPVFTAILRFGSGL